jgi:putative membrane protein
VNPLMDLPATPIPAIEAALNATVAVLLTAGYVSIRRGHPLVHRALMLTAFATSIAFFTLYAWFHAHYGDIHFNGRGWIRPTYFGLLITHVTLAAAIVPLVLITLSRALRGRFARHKRIARWTLPIWLYVSITGVVVYWLLYHPLR